MKQFTIIEKCPNGARFALIPNRFKLLISIKNNMAFLDFIDEQSLETVFGTFFFIDDDSYKNFDDFTEEGQKLLLERLSEVIVADISSFISGEFDDEKEPELPYHSLNGCFDIEAYRENWLYYYELISDDEDILDEYIDPDEQTRRKQ